MPQTGRWQRARRVCPCPNARFPVHSGLQSLPRGVLQLQSEDMQASSFASDIDAKLRSSGVYESVRDVIRRYASEQKAGDGRALREADVMASVVGFLRQRSHAAPSARNERELVVRVDGGKAFVDNFVDGVRRGGGPDAAPRGTLELTMQLGGQRVRSQRVEATVDPDFAGRGGAAAEYRFSLQNPGDSMPSIASLVDVNRPLSIRLVKWRGDNKPGKSAELIACQDFEWRKVLVHGRLQASLPLRGVGALAGPCGLLNIRLDVSPLRLPAGGPGGDSKGGQAARPVFVQETSVSKQIDHEELVTAGVFRRFHGYIKEWWKEFADIRASHRHRFVRLFRRRADGAQAFACTFLAPARAGRTLDSPLQAARFVALLPDVEEVGGVGSEDSVWNGPLSTLSVGGGKEADKAILLASLLLGFGLDAYVCVGARAGGGGGSPMRPEVVFVATRTGKRSVCLWNPVTGERGQVDGKGGWVPLSGTPAAPLWVASIHCAFNGKSFLANVQPSDRVAACSWDLSDRSKWKAVSEQAIEVLPKPPPVPLFPYAGDRMAQEREIESGLRGLIARYRREEHKRGTAWSDEFSYLLAPALAAYEADRCTGRSFGNAEFQQSIRRHIPVGYVFKAVPLQFNHRDPAAMMAALLGMGKPSQTETRNGGDRTKKSVVDLLGTTGDSIRFAVRARVFPYPEDVCATWVMIAVKYMDVS